MKAFKKTCTTVLLLLTITASFALPTNIIEMYLGQPYEISIVTASKETQNITLAYLASPTNPNELVLKTDDLNKEDLQYLLHSADGLVMKSSRIENNKTVIDLTDLSAATYFLIVSNAQVSKTFKIVKKIESNGVLTMSK